MNLGKGRAGSDFNPAIKRRSGLSWQARAKGFWSVTCRDANGNIKWTDAFENLIVNEGLNHLLDVTLSAATQITTWYVGLTDDSPTIAAGDTMSSHTGWVEATGYSESVRETWTDGGVSSQSVDNSSAVASFSINATDTIGGAFLVSDSTKSGSSGTLYAVGAFSGGDRSVVNTDTLEVTATFTMADDGV